VSYLKEQNNADDAEVSKPNFGQQHHTMTHSIDKNFLNLSDKENTNISQYNNDENAYMMHNSQSDIDLNHSQGAGGIPAHMHMMMDNDNEYND
jgi:hypothetical protein